MTDRYDRCRACYSDVVGGHVFKPKRISLKGLISRLRCPCLCHWDNQSAHGITFNQALELYNKTHPKTPMTEEKIIKDLTGLDIKIIKSTELLKKL